VKQTGQTGDASIIGLGTHACMAADARDSLSLCAIHARGLGEVEPTHEESNINIKKKGLYEFLYNIHPQHIHNTYIHTHINVSPLQVFPHKTSDDELIMQCLCYNLSTTS